MKKLYTTLALFCFTAITHHAAVAGDNKVYPGSMCQPREPTQELRITNAGATLLNISDLHHQEVVCPFVRDNTINENGTSGELWVFVDREPPSTTAFRCTFTVSRIEDGGIAFAFHDQFTGLGPARLEIPITHSIPLGPYTMSCVIPPRSMIYGYAVPEF